LRRSFGVINDCELPNEKVGNSDHGAYRDGACDDGITHYCGELARRTRGLVPPEPGKDLSDRVHGAAGCRPSKLPKTLPRWHRRDIRSPVDCAESLDIASRQMNHAGQAVPRSPKDLLISLGGNLPTPGPSDWETDKPALKAVRESLRANRGGNSHTAEPRRHSISRP
jgi:hypothetical protein